MLTPGAKKEMSSSLWCMMIEAGSAELANNRLRGRCSTRLSTPTLRDKAAQRRLTLRLASEIRRPKYLRGRQLEL